MEEILSLAVDLGKVAAKKGFPATYIPELAKSNPDHVGICVVSLDGVIHGQGDYLKSFTLQSITKVISLLLVLEDLGEKEVFTHVHMEPTGDPQTTLHREVYLSEKETGDRNRSLAYFMKSTGMMKGDVEETLDLYFLQCSILGTAKDVATIGAVLSSNGIHPYTQERVISKENARIVKTIMTTCGMYDASGEFAVNCGIPAKSGVGGGILGAVPGKFGLGTYGPSLDLKGNSLAGTAMLEFLSKNLNLSIF